MRSFVSLVLVGILFGSSLTFAQVKEKVSEITGVQRVESEDMNPIYAEEYTGSHATLRAEYVNDPNDGTSWVLSFYGFADNPTEVSETNQFRVLADGQQFEPIRLESRTREINNSLIEIKRAAFTRAAFEDIAVAKDVTISIGPAEFLAIRPRREDMRLILDRVPAEEVPSTASNDSSESQE